MKKKAGTVGIILTVVFLVLGFTSTTPDKYIKSYGNGKMYEYVGGDAYNYIIEASLRGGEIAGAKTARAVYFAAAGILFVLSVSFLKMEEGKDETGDDIGGAGKETMEAKEELTQSNEAFDSQQQLSSVDTVNELEEEALRDNNENDTGLSQ